MLVQCQGIYLTISSVVFKVSPLLIGASPLLIGDSSILVISTSPSGLTILSKFELFALGVPKRSSSDSSSEDTSAIGVWIMSWTKFEPFLGASFFWGVSPSKWFEVWLNNGRFLPNLKKVNKLLQKCK